jgi:hypothetical protein
MPTVEAVSETNNPSLTVGILLLWWGYAQLSSPLCGTDGVAEP